MRAGDLYFLEYLRAQAKERSIAVSGGLDLRTADLAGAEMVCQ